MTSLGLLNNFFNERISKVNGNTKPLLQKLKTICEQRASGRISEEQALFKLDSLMGNGSSPSALSRLDFKTNFKPVLNPLAGARTNHKKEKAVMEGLFDFNNKPRVEQFPVLGLKPLPSNGKRNRFVVSPMNRTWFDVKDFKQPKQNGVVNVNSFKQSNQNGLIGMVKNNRFKESQNAMNNMFKTAMKNQGRQPVLQGLTTPTHPRKGKRVFPKRKQGLAQMMGVKLR
jgi:hypothetical protein